MGQCQNNERSRCHSGADHTLPRRGRALCDQIAIVNKSRIITAKSKADLMASAGKKHLHLTLASPPPARLPKTLQKLGAVWQGGRLSISFDPAKLRRWRC